MDIFCPSVDPPLPPSTCSTVNSTHAVLPLHLPLCVTAHETFWVLIASENGCASHIHKLSRGARATGGGAGVGEDWM